MHLHAVLMEQWGRKRSCAVCFLVLSAAAAAEDPGGPGSGGADAELQLRGQWAPQDFAQDPQEQPCESRVNHVNLSSRMTRCHREVTRQVNSVTVDSFLLGLGEAAVLKPTKHLNSSICISTSNLKEANFLR